MVIWSRRDCLKYCGYLMQPLEWEGRGTNSFTDNDEAIDMAAGDTTPKLIRHTLYTHKYSRRFFFLLPHPINRETRSLADQGCLSRILRVLTRNSRKMKFLIVLSFWTDITLAKTNKFSAAYKQSHKFNKSEPSSMLKN